MDQRMIWSFIVEQKLTELLWLPVKWTLLGGLLGLLIGILAFVFINRFGGYRLEHKTGVWLRVLVGIVTIIGSSVFGLYGGFYEGLIKAVEVVGENKALQEKANPYIGHAGALLIAGLYTACPKEGVKTFTPPTEKAMRASLDGFMAGKWEVNVAELNKRLNNLRGAATNTAIQGIAKQCNISLPEYEDTKKNRIALSFLSAFAKYGLGMDLDGPSDAVKDIELTKACSKIMSGLPAEAALAGDPATISYQELSAYITRQSIQAAVIKTINHAIRAQQIGAGILFLVFLAVPIIAFRIAEYIRQKHAANTAPSQAA